MNKKKLILVAAVLALIGAYFALGLGRYFTLDYLKSQQAAIDASVAARPVVAALAFFAIYVAVTGLSLPGATIMTLAAGAIFGLAWGTVIVSFASTIGATLAFLASRYLFRDAIQRRYGDRLQAFDAGIARD
ncbi:MAG TPA: VTT domain-containing protein, partial [Burkholderiales bacterium]|nr:VTT domain-containing protein [Burkholderiales bacterium]